MPRIERTALKISKDLRRDLTLHRVRVGIAAKPPILDSESVDEVERRLGVELPDTLLAVFAATARDPYEIVLITEEARELCDLPHRLVAVGQKPSKGSRTLLPIYWCVKSGTSASGGVVMIRWSMDPRECREGCSVLEFVRECYDVCSLTPEERIAVDGLSPKLRPAIRRRPRPAARRVLHHRFGPGFVLREFDDGNHKVEVDFPGAGVRLLLASFVQDYPASGVPRKRTR